MHRYGSLLEIAKIRELSMDWRDSILVPIALSFLLAGWALARGNKSPPFSRANPAKRNERAMGTRMEGQLSIQPYKALLF